jgi:hypothetical protein
MHTHMTRALRALLLASTVGVLGFGAHEAFAVKEARAAVVCENYPMCFSEQECQDCCEFLGHLVGTCTAGNACLCS